MSSLKQKAINGTVWTIAGYGCTNFLRLLNNLILTRLLTPDLFGLMALVNTFILGINLFSDLGINPSIINNKRGDDEIFLNTAWTLQVIRGCGIYLVCLIISYPIAQFYNEPKFIWLVPLTGLGSLINAFNSTNLATLNRHLKVNKIIVYKIVVQIIALSVMILWAWFNPTIWALVVGTLCSSVSALVGSYLLVPKNFNRFAWDKSAIKDLVSFGKWIFISTIMTFLALQSDKLILGKLLSKELLGIYTIALTFSDIPKQILGSISGQIILPVISLKQNLPRKELRNKILDNRWKLLLIIIVLLVPLISFGDLLILKLYDKRYSEAAWMLPILALGIWPAVLNLSMYPALIALGKPVYMAAGNFLKFLFMVIGIPLAFHLMGILGAILIVAFNDIPIYIAVEYGLWREKLTNLQQDILITTLFVSLLIVFLFCRYFLGLGFPSFFP